MSYVSTTRLAFGTALLLMAAGCNSTTDTPAPVAEMDSLVSVEWLAEHIDDPDLVVLDCSVMVEPTDDGGFRTVSGRANFEAGHIPTAGFADLHGALSDPDSPLDYAVPDPEVFAAAMAELGVGDDTRVVLYDANMSVWAARVWWMLRWIGFDNAALLDGGQVAWTAAGHELSQAPASEPVRALSVKLLHELIVDNTEVHDAHDDESVDLIDALPEAQYRGDAVMYARPGHIPTASNVSVMSLRAEDGRFRSTEELDALFDGDRDQRTITYCGGGIAASGNAFIMTRLGFEDVAVYTASLQEWAADPSLPMETSKTTDAE